MTVVLYVYTLPETNKSHQQNCMVGSDDSFPFGAVRPIFRGDFLLVSGRGNMRNDSIGSKGCQ